jgi:hypothetical protein
MSEKYHIVVGGTRPKTIKVGTVLKNTGSTIINEKGETLAKRGEVIFPNKCKIWAARTIGGKIPENMVDITDASYKGQIQGLKWGDPKGTLIEVRYIKGLPSLDVLYQEVKLGFKVDESKESSAEAFFLQLPNGENDFNETTDALLIQHLKWHSYNLQSVSKDPSFFTTMFYEKSFEQEETMNSLIIDYKFEAGKILREAVEGAESIEKCKNLFRIVQSITDEEPEETKMYSYLKIIADKKPSEFLKAIDDYKVKISDTYEKVKIFEVADWSVDGILAASDKKGKKKEVILSDMPTKGEGIFDYMIANFTEPKVFEASYKLIQITDKL